MLSVFLLLAPQCGLSWAQTDSVQDEVAAEVNALIRDLRDSEFTVREAATQKLIRIGEPVVVALKLAAESDSLEVRVRVESILASIAAEHKSSGNQSTIDRFKAADVTGRLAILNAQAIAKNTELFLRLLDIAVADEESTDDGGQAESSIERLITAGPDNQLSRWIFNEIVNHRWAAINKILTHPGILKYSPLLRVNAARNAGEFESYIDGLFQKYAQAQATAKTVSSRELVSLIGLLRVQQDFERAETVIGWLADAELQRMLRRELLLQQGDWEEILRRTKLDVNATDFISGSLLQQGLLHHLLEDESGVEQVVQALRLQLKTATEATGNSDKLPAQVKRLRGDLRTLGAVTLNWPLLQEFLDAENVVDNVDLLVIENRPAEALELLGIGPDFKDRQTWMETTLKEIADATKKRNAKPKGQGLDEQTQLLLSIEEKRQLLSSVAEITEEWGLDDEAQLYYQMIFASTQFSRSNDQQKALEQLMQVGRINDYWQLVASILEGPNKGRYVGRSSFGFKDGSVAKSLASQWLNRIRGEIVDPLKQAKTLAAVMNSPWVDREKFDFDFDLDVELARYRTRSDLNASGVDEYTLARVLELNGRDEAAKEMETQAVKLGFLPAIRRKYIHAIASDDPKEILKYWLNDDAGAVENSWDAEEAAFAEEAALKLLATETDPQEIKLIKDQLAVCQIAIAAQWFGGSQWARRGAGELQAMEKSHLAISRLQCMVYGVSGDNVHKDAQHRQLGTALASKDSNQKHQGGIELATFMFDELAHGTVAHPVIVWSLYAKNMNLALAQGMIEHKEYDRAADLLVRLADFSAGDVSAGEVVIKELDRLGATEAADRIYNAIGKHYVDVLEDYPDSPLARNNYAWLSASSNRNLEAARRHASIAVKLRPHVQQYADTLAEIEFLLGRPAAAFKLSKRCVQLDPTRTYYRQQKERFRRAMIEAEAK